MRQVLLPIACISWLCGIGWGSTASPVSPQWAFLLAIAGLALTGASRLRIVNLFGIVVLTVLVGMVWSDTVAREDAARVQVWQERSSAAVILEGISDEPDVRGASVRVRLRDVMDTKTGERLPGLAQATLRGETRVQENDRLRVAGRMTVPETRDADRGSFDAFRYFSRFGVYGLLQYPNVQIIEPGTPTALTRLRQLLHERIQRALPEPSAGLLSAILLSYDRDLASDLRDAFAGSGLSHLIAISGSHIAVLAAAVFFGATAMGFRRGTAAGVTLALSVIFLALVDAPASGVRALLMAATVFWAYAAGRRLQGFRALLLAAALMTAANPRILLGDVGFQLSALAMWGLLVLYPVLAEPFRNRRDVLGIRTILLLTLAAEIATAPLVAYAFGRVSIVGLLTNIAAVPLFPLLLVAALMAATLGGVAALQPVLSLLAGGVSELFIALARISAGTPGAQIMLDPFSPAVLFALYAALFAFPILVTIRKRAALVPVAVPQIPAQRNAGMPTSTMRS